MRTITARSVMNAISWMLPPQPRQRSGSTSYIRAIRRAQARAPGEAAVVGSARERMLAGRPSCARMASARFSAAAGASGATGADVSDCAIAGAIDLARQEGIGD